MYEKLALATAVGAAIGALVTWWYCTQAAKNKPKSGGGPGEADEGPKP